jgi:hypothetical protein
MRLFCVHGLNTVLMSPKLLLFMAAMFAVPCCFSQYKQLTASIYFESDSYTLRKDAVHTLSRLADTLSKIDASNIRIQGNTDSDGDSLYNLSLSEKRAAAVIEFLMKKGCKPGIFGKSHFGESKPKAENSTERGKQQNRRVDIVVTYRPKQSPPPPSAPKPEPPVATPAIVSECTEDTTVILPAGTMLTFNKCEYLARRDCLNFNEIFDPEAARAAGLNTTDNRLNPLVSGGMLDLSARNGCTESCFQQPVKTRIPVPDNISVPSAFNFYEIDPRSGRWTQNKLKVAIVVIDGQQYFEFMAFCPAKINMDKGVNSSDLGRTTLKVPRKYRILNATIYSADPFSVYDFKPGTGKRYLLRRIQVPCFTNNSYVDIVALNRNGDTLHLTEKRRLGTYTHRHWCSDCGKFDRTDQVKALVVPFKTRGLYRRYVFRRSEFTTGAS